MQCSPNGSPFLSHLLTGLFYVIGIVIKYENMTYRTAVHHAHLVLGLYGKGSKYIRDLFEHPDVSARQFDSDQTKAMIDPISRRVLYRMK